MNDIGFLAQFAYDTGMNPIDYATVNVIRAHIDAHLDPAHFPGEENPVTAALSRRILGDLLDAGWAPPDTSERNKQ
jgi:hypothetical protein